jgi:hypothetical protein
MSILKILIGFNGNSNGGLELKDGYPKLTLFKVCVLFLKIDKKSEVISEVFPYFYFLFFSV